MRTLLKIFLMPIVLLLNVLLMFAKGILYIAGGIMNILAIICVIAGIVGLTNDLYSYMIVPSFLSAFLLSPFGIQFIAIFLTVNVELLRDWVKAI